MHPLRWLKHDRARALERRITWPCRQATSRFRTLPHFLIIGAQKAGTTSLFHYLSQHRRIREGLTKEVHFFDGGLDPGVDTYEKGERWYRAHFPLNERLGEGVLTGEATPLYIFNPLAAGRIHRLIPDVKLVAVLRNPADRAISHYLHERARGREPLGLTEALRAEDDRLKPALESRNFKDFAFIHHSYKTRGHYSQQLETFLRYFRRKQLLVISSEALFASPRATLDKVLDFLGIDEPSDWMDLAPKNIARAHTDIDPETYADLNAYFETQTEQMRHLFNVDLRPRAFAG